MKGLLPRFVAIAVMGTAIIAGEEEEVYHLKASDIIRLSVFGEPDLAREVKLTVTGEASLPLIGAVQLSGMTLREAEQTVTDLYDADYLVEPKVNINLVDAAMEAVAVMGAVNKPGTVGIPPNTSLDLASAVAAAGGLADHADDTRVELKRGDSVNAYDLEEMNRRASPPVMLEHGDRINVPSNPFANERIIITGEVERPGDYKFPDHGALDLNTLVALAGDFTDEADPDRITVKRGEDLYSAPMESAGGRNLKPGDIVTVPKSRFVGKFVNVMGQVRRGGAIEFPVDGRLDVLTAISLAGGFDRLANKKKVQVIRRVGDNNRNWKLNLLDMAEGEADLFYLSPGDQVTVPVRRF